MGKVKVRNVIFDFGGVLFEIDYHAPVREFKKIGFSNFEEIYSQASQSQLFDRAETGKISNEDFYTEIHSYCPTASRKEVIDAWNSILLHLMPEKVEVVAKTKEAGMRVFLLSNTNAIHVAEFERMIEQSYGLEKFKSYFEKVYYSNEIGIKKPYPETFLEVCKWNDLDPSETLFIDDSVQHVEGAKKAGLQVAHLKSDYTLEQIFADFIL
jgi:putative hydrolase of the HAD superfamily